MWGNRGSPPGGAGSTDIIADRSPRRHNAARNPGVPPHPTLPRKRGRVGWGTRLRGREGRRRRVSITNPPVQILHWRAFGGGTRLPPSISRRMGYLITEEKHYEHEHSPPH